MFTPPMFKPDRAASLAFAEARGFGTVCAWDGGRPVASSLPFYLDYRPMTARRTRCFMSRAAMRWLRWQTANRTGCWRSTARMPMFRRTGTSRRIRCRPGSIRRCICRVRSASCPTPNSAAHLDVLSAKFESWLAPKPPWTSVEVTAGRREAMMQAIVGLMMTVEEIEGSFKLNQHKSDVDHVAIAAALLRAPTKPRRRSENRWSRCGRSWTTNRPSLSA